MNVYDFDKTIFYPDSSFKFSLFCLRRYPGCFKIDIGDRILAFINFALYKHVDDNMKEAIFSYIKYLPDVGSLVEEFWDEHEKDIQSWYLQKKQDDDIIISASPEFLIGPIAKRLGVRYIATRLSPNSGKICGTNCHDEEKVRRFRQEYPGAHIDEFYSDSLSDTPMAKIADKAFIVNKGEIGAWPE